MATLESTIAAIATPHGIGGVGVIRLSGPKVRDIAIAMCGCLPSPRTATLTSFMDKDGQAIDSGLAIYFPGPNSFTGEDVLELQGHGGQVVMSQLLNRAMSLGAEAAKPGEFSLRAFLNDKVDLTQAEAIADLIEAQSEQAAKMAMRSLQGQFSSKVHDIAKELLAIRVYTEAAIDFPTEEIDLLHESKLAERLAKCQAQLGFLLEHSQTGVMYQSGLNVVVLGQPNVGKSSLLNALVDEDVAIVTDIPGTTRDVIREKISLDGIPLHIVDTAGIRSTEDVVEQEGVKRAATQAQQADIILMLGEAGRQQPFEETNQAFAEAGLSFNVPVIKVLNKVDLLDFQEIPIDGKAEADVAISAKFQRGIATLKETIKQVIGISEQSESTFLARQRHVDALRHASEALRRASGFLATSTFELMAEELKASHQALGEITGAVSSDALLGEIFSHFCIGK